MSIKEDLVQLERDVRRAGVGFAWDGIRARGGRLTAPVTLLDHFGRSSKLPVGRIAVDCPGLTGTPMIVRRGGSDFWIVREVFRDKGYDLSSHPAAEMRLRARYSEILEAASTPLIVDAGANIGAATRWLKQSYPKAAIVAIEPDSGNCKVLRQNVANLPGITVVEAAIGSNDGFVALSETPDACAVQTTRASHGLPIITVSQAVEKVDKSTLFIVKVDIEGFESDLFRENVDWIGSAYAVYIEPHDWMLPGKGTSRNFQVAMAKHDFELLILGENLLYLRR